MQPAPIDRQGGSRGGLRPSEGRVVGHYEGEGSMFDGKWRGRVRKERAGRQAWHAQQLQRLSRDWRSC